ncbi:MAG: hypothetical protein HA488_01995 [Candidatus Verstraetearchaeota archaeon]|nr:hypothetical protein [Candidatus Verstraetearchaeota archaeon]
MQNRATNIIAKTPHVIVISIEAWNTSIFVIKENDEVTNPEKGYEEG